MQNPLIAKFLESATLPTLQEAPQDNFIVKTAQGQWVGSPTSKTTSNPAQAATFAYREVGSLDQFKAGLAKLHDGPVTIHKLKAWHPLEFE